LTTFRRAESQAGREREQQGPALADAGLPPGTVTPRKLFTAIALLFTLGVSTAARAEKTIYLTFDMDMNEAMYKKTAEAGEIWYRQGVFSYLQESKIPATFFVSGLFAIAYPALIKSLALLEPVLVPKPQLHGASFTPHCYCYGPKWPAQFRRTADYVDKILRGTKPADIPVEQPTRFDLFTNLATAKGRRCCSLGPTR
jgi:hypothetical protein